MSSAANGYPQYVETYKFEGHTRAISCVKFSPNGQYLASSSADITIRIYRINTNGTEMMSANFEFCLPRPDADSEKRHAVGINDLVWSIDNKFLCSCSDDKSIIVWDVEKRTAVSRLYGHDDWVFSISMHPNGEVLASADYRGEVKIWDFKSGKCVKSITAHNAPVTCVVFNEKIPGLLATGSYDGTCRIMSDYEHVKTFCNKKRAPVGFVRFSPNGQYICVSTLDGALRLYDANGVKEGKGEKINKHVREFTGHTNKEFCCASRFRATSGGGGKFVMSGSEDNRIYIWEVGKRNVPADLAEDASKNRLYYPAQKLEGHKDKVLAFDYQPELRLIASGSAGFVNKDWSVRLWEDKSTPTPAGP